MRVRPWHSCAWLLFVCFVLAAPLTAQQAPASASVGGTVREPQGEPVTGLAEPPAFQQGSKLSPDGWHLRGCPEAGARIAAAPDGALWAAWFTGGGAPGVYVSVSRDGGASFGYTLCVTGGTKWRPYDSTSRRKPR